MATNTTNLHLIKPAGSERVQISQINQNMDILDEKIGAVGNTSLQGQITAANGLISSLKNQVAIPQAFGGDCNDITETCVVYVTDSAIHAPDYWSIMSTYVFDASNAICQNAMSVVYGTMKTRYKNGNGWSEWFSLNDHIEYTSSTAITNLNSIPVNSQGRITLGASVSPSRSELIVNFKCYGVSTRKTLEISSVNTGNSWTSVYNGTSWSSWESITDRFRMKQVASGSVSMPITRFPTLILFRDGNAMDGAVMLAYGENNAITICKWGTKTFDTTMTNGTFTVGTGNMILALIG